MKRAIIVGADGQDGRLLGERLKSGGIPCLRVGRYEWAGPGNEAIPFAGLQNAQEVKKLVRDFQPTQIYYLAACHHSAQDQQADDLAATWEESVKVQVMGLVSFLEAIRLDAPGCRLFYAASSHLFGTPPESPQNEDTPFAPETIYGITKLAGLQACRHYRRQYGQFTSVGILYNHESVYRQNKFLSQKIIQGALAIRAGRQKMLSLGDLSAEVDWGYAPDYVEAMVRMLEHPEPNDYVVATGRLHTVRQFVALVFEQLQMDFSIHIREDPALLTRPHRPLRGDSSRLRRDTLWNPTLSFEEMVRKLTLDSQQLAGERAGL